MSDFNTIKNDAKNRMDKTLEALKADFAGLRAGRAHISLLDGIMVEAYGSMTPLSQVGTVSVPDARTLSVSVWDRSLAKAVEKAILESDLGLNPASDGQLIRIPIPPLSEERRKELVKVAGKYSEQSKVAVRNVRRDALDECAVVGEVRRLRERMPMAGVRKLQVKLRELAEPVSGHFSGWLGNLHLP